MTYAALLVDITNGVATITLNRPEKLNAYNAAMGAELSQAFAALDGDDQVRVIVVTGAGRAFCAGADLSTAGGDTFNYDKRRERGELREEPAIRPWNMKKPIIAAINGPAVGVGHYLADAVGHPGRCRERANRLCVRATRSDSGSAQPVDPSAADRPGQSQRAAHDGENHLRPRSARIWNCESRLAGQGI